MKIQKGLQIFGTFIIPIIAIGFKMLGYFIQYLKWKFDNSENDSNYQFKTENIREILSKYFAYYRSLQPKEKLKFERRVDLFIGSKKFYGKSGLEVVPEMKILIAAAAVQLTFGFSLFKMPHFVHLVIYPKSYISKLTKKSHHGEVHPAKGIIVMSWERFLKGYSDTDDGINLGIHEMAHALFFQNYSGQIEGSFLDNEILDFLSKRFMAMKKIKREHNFFRAYGFSNFVEFFSVLCENFFERPDEFFENEPEIYLKLSDLLNQDLRTKLNMQFA